MEPKYIEALKEQVKFTGFGVELDEKIDRKIKKGDDTFELKATKEFGEFKADAVLYFSKSEQDNYFFNKYKVTAAGKDGQELEQTFLVFRGKQANVKIPGQPDSQQWINSTVTLQEAFNLLRGRSIRKNFVSKDGQKFTKWCDLDFNDKDQYGNYILKKHDDFDIAPILKEYPIREAEHPGNRQLLINKLEKGNPVPVTFALQDSSERKMFIEAVGKHGAINIYDENKNLMILWKDPTKDLVPFKKATVVAQNNIKTEAAEATPANEPTQAVSPAQVASAETVPAQATEVAKPAAESTKPEVPKRGRPKKQDDTAKESIPSPAPATEKPATAQETNSQAPETRQVAAAITEPAAVVEAKPIAQTAKPEPVQNSKPARAKETNSLPVGTTPAAATNEKVNTARNNVQKAAGKTRTRTK